MNVNNTEAGTESKTEKVKIIINEDGKTDTYYLEQTDDNVYEIETEDETADNSEKENEENKKLNSVWIIILILFGSLFIALVNDFLNYIKYA